MSETIVRVTRVIEVSPGGAEVDVTHELNGEVLEYIKSARKDFGLSDEEIEVDLIAHFAPMRHPSCYDDVDIIGDTVRLYAFDEGDEEGWPSFV